jgi:hypothetical protein
MHIDHDMHRARVKALSNNLGHSMSYHDAGAIVKADRDMDKTPQYAKRVRGIRATKTAMSYR